ncbi:MAG: SH3 domain-containing protein [Candidatus Omnitrophota bacterium]
MPLKLKFKPVFISLVFLGLASFAWCETASFIGQVSVDDINVRVDSTVTSAIVCSLPKASLVEVVSEAYDWYKIRLPKRAPSYVRKDLVECINTDQITGKCVSAKVIKDRINVRLSPNESGWIVGKINNLTVLNIVSETKDWYKIQPVHQSFGWVNKKFINKNLAHLVKKAEPLAGEKEIKQEVKAGKQLILEGVISPYGVVLWRKATHKLITSDNKLYFLKGNRKSLNSLNYHRVKVTGKLITPQESNHPIIEVDIIELLN